MSHVHHDHAGHGHAPGHAHDHHHAHVLRTRPAPDLSGSLLRASAAARLGVAAGLVALIWAAVFWAAA